MLEHANGSQYVNPWLHPPGGFMNLLQSPHVLPFTQVQQPSENFQFGRAPMNLGAFSPPLAPVSKDPPLSSPSAAVPKNRVTIDVDKENNVEVDKNAKRMNWTHDDEVRLVSAWLKNSNDPIDGNGKKNEKFWSDVNEEYNKNSPSDRRRDMNVLKQHWQRLKTEIGHFNGCWTRTVKRHGSGMSDDQMMDEALQLYEREKGKPFTLIHWWRILKNQPKWCAHVDRMAKDKDKGSTVQRDVNADVIDVEEDKRPIGRDAGKADRNGKRKKQDALDGVVLLGEKIDKVAEGVTAARKERVQMTEVQQRLSSERLEAAKLSVEAAKLSVEAANRQKEGKMFDALTAFLREDTSGMTEQAKANRQRAIDSLTSKLLDTNGN